MILNRIVIVAISPFLMRYHKSNFLNLEAVSSWMVNGVPAEDMTWIDENVNN